MKKTSRLLPAKTVAATFGAAFASIGCTPELNAEIVELTFNGGNLTTSNPFVPDGLLKLVDIDQVPNDFGFLGDFAANNNMLFDGSGRTHFIELSFGINFNIASHIALGPQPGMTIDPATFAGTTAPVGVTEFDGSGSAIVAFRTAAGNVGWYKLTFETAGPVHYGPGQLGTNGEAVNVDDSSNSCPFEIGDVNADRLINLLDVAPFIDLIANSGFECQADVNEDLAVDLLDVEPFITILLNN